MIKVAAGIAIAAIVAAAAGPFACAQDRVSVRPEHALRMEGADPIHSTAGQDGEPLLLGRGIR